jgi:hypothetical protein
VSFFFPEDGLERASPEKTRITTVETEPYPDGDRVRVQLEMTPFATRPHIDVALTDVQGIEVASASIVEPMSWRLEFTLHLRGARNGPFTLTAHLFYPDGPDAEPVTRTFEVAPPSG